MYKLCTVKHVVRIPPALFGENLKDAAFRTLSDEFNGHYLPELGFVIVVHDVLEIGDGKILYNEPATFHEVVLQILCHEPMMHEVVEGYIIESVDFGAFIQLGPTDGLCHVSQLMDDFVDYRSMEQQFLGRESGKQLLVNDKVRGRIIAISQGSGRSGKLGLTMRQPYLGKIEWIKEQIEFAGENTA